MNWKKLKTMKKNEWFKHLILYGIGIFIIPLGAVLTVNAHLGAGGYDALNFAIADRMGLPVSYAVSFTAFIVLSVTAFMRRSYPRVETFVTSYLQGLSTDFWKEIVEGIQGTEFIDSLIILVVGLLVIGVGAGCYMNSIFPTNAVDDLVLAMREKKVSISISKTCTDGLYVVLAFLVGGEIGVGTIICTFALAPIIDVFHKSVSSFIKKFERKAVHA